MSIKVKKQPQCARAAESLLSAKHGYGIYAFSLHEGRCRATPGGSAQYRFVRPATASGVELKNIIGCECRRIDPDYFSRR